MRGNQYASGYQDALRDIANALNSDGEDGVRTWLSDNRVRENQNSEPTDKVEKTEA